MIEQVLPAEVENVNSVKENYRLLDLCLRFGAKLLAAGAETFRVEDSIQRIIQAYGRKAVSAFAIPTLLLITFQDEDGSIYTSSRRIVNRGTDFNRLDALNSLSRTLCSGNRKSLDFFSSQLEDIAALEQYPLQITILAAVVVAVGFAYVFGATVQDMFFAGLVAFIVKSFQEFLNRLKLNSTYVNLLSSFIAGASMEWLAVLSLVLNPQTATVAVIMNLVPGMLITTSIHDIVNKDFTSGLNKLVEATFIALALAIGTGIAVILLR